MPVLRLFAAAREAAGTGSDRVPGDTVAEVLEQARARYGTGFADVLCTCKVWVDGQPAADEDAVAEDAEVAVLPPVSGGCGRAAAPGS